MDFNIFFSEGIGTFVSQIMENINLNIWVSRGTVCLVSVIVALKKWVYLRDGL